MSTATKQQDPAGRDEIEDPTGREPARSERRSTARNRGTRRRAALPPAAHVGPATRAPDHATVLAADVDERKLLDVARDVEPTHLTGCPSDPDLFDDPEEALRTEQPPTDGTEPRLRRVERYKQRHVDGYDVAIVRCIDCGAHTIVEPTT